MRAVFALPALVLIVAPAEAAERFRPAETATSARACPQHGPGFVEVPGTSTCIRIGGRVRAEYGMTSRRPFPRDRISGFAPSGALSADVRTETGAGPLRAYVRTRMGGGPPLR